MLVGLDVDEYSIEKLEGVQGPYLAFGIDLRNHDRERLWEDGYADA